MDATLIVIDSDASLRARALVDRLMASDKPADIARLAAQARLIAGYEQSKWPRRPPRAADVIRYLMDQHGAFARGHDPDPSHGEPRQRGSSRQEGTEHVDDPAAANPI